MINGDVQEFAERISSGQDTVYIFQGIKYWFQGWTTPNGFHVEIFQDEPPAEDLVWQHDDVDPYCCQNAFLEAPIFDGKTFWEVEQSIEWVDN